MGTQHSLFNLPPSDIKAGIRLYKVELLNWGTFNKFIWPFEFNGDNTLIYGASGSGKSSVIDAIQTLLVDGRKFNYNQAAGSGPRERTIHTYVLGTYGRTVTKEGRTIPEKLRDFQDYSVILAVFKDEKQNKTVTLAMLLYYKGDESNGLEKKYIIAEKELSIKKDFEEFKGGISALRKYFKDNNIKMMDTYAGYYSKFSKLLGGLDEQALNIFQQAIHMKKVDSLTQFVREYILERNRTIDDEINKLIDNFEDLNVSYEKALEAKKQVELLRPIRTIGKKRNDLLDEITAIKIAQEVLLPWTCEHKVELLETEIENLNAKQSELEEKKSVKVELKKKLGKEIDELLINIGEQGGNAIANCQKELKRENEKKETVKRKIVDYTKQSQLLKLKVPYTKEEFDKNQNELRKLYETLPVEIGNYQQKLDEITIEKNDEQRKSQLISEELESLKSRTSNIPKYLVNIQQKLCDEFNLQSKEIPFAGELIEVTDLQWEGAIERLLRGFAKSLLIPKHLYNEISKYINDHHLKNRLVYHFVDNNITNLKEMRYVDDNSVLKKITLKDDINFKKWLENFLTRSYNYQCCATIEILNKCSRGLTIEGQIRSNTKHEKDDSRKIDDRSYYCLGFTNEKKINMLTQNLDDIRNVISLIQDKYVEIEKNKKVLESQQLATSILLQYKDFEELNLKNVEERIAELVDRIAELEKNDKLRYLKNVVAQKRDELALTETEINNLVTDTIATTTKRENFDSQLRKNKEKIKIKETIECYETGLALVLKIYKEKINTQLSLANVDEISDNIRRFLEAQLDKKNENEINLRDKLITSIGKFVNKFEITSFDANVNSLEECNVMLEELEKDKLYKLEKEFKDGLHDKVGLRFGFMNSTFSESEKKICTKIEKINRILSTIEFNVGTYITINVNHTNNSEINEFRAEINSCIGGQTDDETVLETRFKAARTLIEKFKQQGTNTPEGRWVGRVTDVRNWFAFSATEKDQETGKQREHYDDSSGKSGGQKEKLAYTILGAGLSYNYFMDNSQEIGFRVVIIDEAFLKSSNDAARFGLELFKNLKFQFILATPGNNLEVIGKYVKSVCNVEQDEMSRESRVQNIKIGKFLDKITLRREDINE